VEHSDCGFSMAKTAHRDRSSYSSFFKTNDHEHHEYVCCIKTQQSQSLPSSHPNHSTDSMPTTSTSHSF
jgi:hypothetical protein